MRRLSKFGGHMSLGWLLLCAAQFGFAGEAEDDQRARLDYMLNCQGCHLHDGAGAGDVPNMKDFVGSFLNVPGGRAFLVQVPGSRNAALDDARLAGLLNWMLREIGGNQVPADFRPYTVGEVAEYRSRPLRDVRKTRAELMEKMRRP